MFIGKGKNIFQIGLGSLVKQGICAHIRECEHLAALYIRRGYINLSVSHQISGRDTQYQKLSVVPIENC